MREVHLGLVRKGFVAYAAHLKDGCAAGGLGGNDARAVGAFGLLPTHQATTRSPFRAARGATSSSGPQNGETIIETSTVTSQIRS